MKAKLCLQTLSPPEPPLALLNCINFMGAPCWSQSQGARGHGSPQHWAGVILPIFSMPSLLWMSPWSWLWLKCRISSLATFTFLIIILSFVGQVLPFPGVHKPQDNCNQKAVYQQHNQSNHSPIPLAHSLP